MENVIFGYINYNLLQTFDARAGWLQAWLTKKCKITENKGSAFRKILLSTNSVFFGTVQVGWNSFNRNQVFRWWQKLFLVLSSDCFIFRAVQLLFGRLMLRCFDSFIKAVIRNKFAKISIVKLDINKFCGGNQVKNTKTAQSCGQRNWIKIQWRGVFKECRPWQAGWAASLLWT